MYTSQDAEASVSSARRGEHRRESCRADDVVSSRKPQHVLMQRLSDGHVSDAGIALFEGGASSRFADVLWLRVGRPCAHVAVRHANDERYQAVVRRLVICRGE